MGRPSRPPEPGRRRFPRSRRITRGSEIRGLFRRGKRSKTANLDVFDSPSPFVHPRVALVVPLHGRSAVERNRLKRRLREVARLELLPRLDSVDPPRDVLIRARRQTYEAEFEDLKRELVTWIERRWGGESSS